MSTTIKIFSYPNLLSFSVLTFIKWRLNTELLANMLRNDLNKGNAKRGVSPHLKIRPCDLDLWPWKSIGFLVLLRSKYVPSLVKIHWRMLILVFTRMLCGKNLTPWPLNLKINKVSDSPKDHVFTKFGQNPLKDVDSRVFTRMLRGKNLTRWHWPLTLKINRVPDSPKD